MKTSNFTNNEVCEGCPSRGQCKIPCPLIEPLIDYKEVIAEMEEAKRARDSYYIEKIRALPTGTLSGLRKKILSACLFFGIVPSQMSKAAELLNKEKSLIYKLIQKYNKSREKKMDEDK